MKITFKCNIESCENEFSINTKYIDKVDNIICPCCGNKLNENAWIIIKSQVKGLDETLSKFSEKDIKFLIEIHLQNPLD